MLNRNSESAAMRRLSLWLCLLIILCGMETWGCSHRQTEADSPETAKQESGGLLSKVPDRSPAIDWIHFTETAAAGGLHYRWTVSGKRPLNILQTIGNGCAFLDYDNDGNLDILLVGPKLALYKGDGNGHFTDVTHEAGLDKLSGNFLGCAVGDYDNDGFDDVYISGYQTGLLLHNEQGKRFKDVTKEAGIQPQPWGTSASFADLDGDGDLDLFICNYVAFGPDSPQLCQRDGILTACHPGHYPSLKGVLYHNLGGHGFADVTHAWGVDTQTGNALGVACADFDGSGRPGLAIANDEPGDDLFRNLGPGRLENIGARAGTRTDRDGNKHAGMGIDWGDVDNDGRLDLFVTTFEREAKCLYHNEGNDLFTEQSAAAGIEKSMMPLVSFGCKFLDVDNAGRLDILVADGHVEDNVDQTHHGVTYREPLTLLYNTGGKAGQAVTFRNLKHYTGLDKLAPIVGRGLAVGDFDNDGRVDALVVDSEGAPLLLHNQTKPVGHWIGFRLIGSGTSNRDAYGAVVTVEAGGERRMCVCHADGSYLSSSDKRVHIGLGKANRIDKVTVRWPDGRTETRTNLPADRYLNWNEGRLKKI
jgi:hypothetical protein